MLTTDQENTTNRCGYCRQSYECGVLKSALSILETHVTQSKDPECQNRLKAFMQKIEKLGYNYPASPSFCHLQDDKPTIRSLINEAIHIRNAFDKRLEASKSAAVVLAGEDS